MLKAVGPKALERSFPQVEGSIPDAISEAFPTSVNVKIDSEESFKNLM
jgi:hypothetical protein